MRECPPAVEPSALSWGSPRGLGVRNTVLAEVFLGGKNTVALEVVADSSILAPGDSADLFLTAKFH